MKLSFLYSGISLIGYFENLCSLYNRTVVPDLDLEILNNGGFVAMPRDILERYLRMRDSLDRMTREVGSSFAKLITAQDPDGRIADESFELMDDCKMSFFRYRRDVMDYLAKRKKE